VASQSPFGKSFQALFYPREAGLRLGSSLSTRFVRLEIHYNNPETLSGVIDQSGIRFYYVNNLRKYDVGVLEVGMTYTPDMAIPPRQSQFLWKGRCPSSCTKKVCIYQTNAEVLNASR